MRFAFLIFCFMLGGCTSFSLVSFQVQSLNICAGIAVKCEQKVPPPQGKTLAEKVGGVFAHLFQFKIGKQQ